MKRDQFRILFIRKDIGQMLAVQKLFSYENFVHALSGATVSIKDLFMFTFFSGYKRVIKKSNFRFLINFNF